MKATVAGIALAMLAVGAQGPEELEETAFLAGSWEGETGQARIEEHWIPSRGGMMLGVSRTVVSGKTVSFEFLRIEKRDEGIFYVAQPGGRPPTEFRLTGHTDASATFENPAHDHPKLIRYRLEADGSLVASIEGEENGEPVSQDFVYHRASPAHQGTPSP
jgi:hypothetical protein